MSLVALMADTNAGGKGLIPKHRIDKSPNRPIAFPSEKTRCPSREESACDSPRCYRAAVSDVPHLTSLFITRPFSGLFLRWENCDELTGSFQRSPLQKANSSACAFAPINCWKKYRTLFYVLDENTEQ